jgi:hypothetical protein
MGCREFCCLGCLSTNNKKIDDENESRKPKNNKPSESANKSFHDTVIQKRKSISSSSASTITDVNSRNRFKYNVNINNNKANNVEKMNNKIDIVNSAKISVNKDFNVNESKKRRFKKKAEDGFVSSTSADDDDPKDIDYIVEKIYRTRKQKQKLNSSNIFSDVDLIENNNNNLLAQSQHKIKNANFQANHNPCKTAQKNSASISKRNASGYVNDETSTKSAMNSEFYLNRSNSINSSINSTIENTINNNLNDIVIGANAASGNSTAETYLIDRYNYAVRHIKQGLSVEEACNKYRISKGALLKCLSGGTAPRGKKTRLTETEENEIVEWLISDKDLKYNDAIHLVFEKVVTIFKEAQRPNPFNNGRPSMDWWYDFLSRHPQIMASKPDWLMRGKVNDQYIKDVQSGQLKCTKFRRALLSAIQYIQTLNDAESTNSLNAIAAASSSCSNKTQKISTSSAKSAKQETHGAHRLASDNNSKVKANSLPKTANSSGSSSSGSTSSFPSNLAKPTTTGGGTRVSKTLNDELLAEKKKRRNTMNSSSSQSFQNANHSANKSYKSSSSSTGQTSLTINSTGMLNNSMATNSSSNNNNNNNESIRLNLINNTNFSNSSSNGNNIHHDPANNLNIEFNDEDLSSVPSFSLISSSNNKLSRAANSNTNNTNNQFYLTDNKCQSRHFFNDLDVNNNNNNNSYFNQRSQASNGLSGLNVCDNNEENTNEDENEFDSEFLNATLNVDDNQLSELIDPSGIADDHDEYDNDEDINIDGLSSLANPHLNSALSNFYSFNKPNHVSQQHHHHHPSQNLNNMSIKSNDHQSGILSHQNSDGFHLNMSLNAPHGMSHPKNSYYPHHHTLNKQQNHLLVPDDDDENDDDNDNNSNNNNTSIVNNDEDDAYMGETIDPSAFLP